MRRPRLMSDSSHQKEINLQIFRLLESLAIQSSCYSQQVMINLEALYEMILDSSNDTVKGEKDE